MRVLITGGPGAGSTSTAKRIGSELDIPVFDSDTFFHKPTNPPFQEQYSPDERRRRLSEALGSKVSWILSGSIATWALDLEPVQFGVFLDIPKGERLQRLIRRERDRFGIRIDEGGDLHQEHKEFMQWAAGYEIRTGGGRNKTNDRDFLCRHCENFMVIHEIAEFEKIVFKIHQFLDRPTEEEEQA